MSSIIAKTAEELDLMRHAGQILQQVQIELKNQIKPGVRLIDLDAVAEKMIRDAKAYPSFKGFSGFPASLCTMINSEIVHGIPDERSLKEGDILSVDCGVTYKGYIADAAFTVVVGGDEAHPQRARFSQVVEKALKAGCEAAKTGNTLGDIGWAIQKKVEGVGYNLVKEYTGHGVGTAVHEEPYVLNYGRPGQGMKLIEGMTICIEPIVCMGNPKNKLLSDNWTVVTMDGKDACQWEHCGVVTSNGLEIFA